ncbi:MAG: APC family permease [Solirubrobacteraceae bacterium]
MGTTSTAGFGAQEQHEHKLEAGALHFLDSVVMAVAGSAPAYSISATTAVIVGAVGLASPAALLWCGIPMLGISVAYHQLNKMGADAGAAYAWVGKVLHPYLGFLAGWCLVVSATIFMVAGSLPAGQATLSLFSAHLSTEAGWYTAVGAVWFLVMAVFVARGVRITANAQWVMSSIEILLLIVFVVLGFAHGHKVMGFSWSWLWFSHFGSAGKFADGALLAAFYYWGWDVASNLGEETSNSERNSGAGGIASVIICLILFELFTIVINMDLSQKAVTGGAVNPLQGLGQVVGSSAGAKLMVIALMLSTIATLETTLIQVTRSLFSMAREHTLPGPFGRLRPGWNTPVFATVVVSIVSLATFIAANFVGGINTILLDAESAIDLQISIYYALAGFAAVVAFRRYALRSAKNLLLMCLFPLLGACFMLYIFVEALATGTVSGVAVWLGVGGMVIAIGPIAYYGIKGSAYLRQKPTLGRVDIGTPVSGAEMIV